MRFRPILILLALFAANGAFAQAYTWTDEDGVVHYSDRPQPGAKIINLPTFKTGSSTRARTAQSRSSTAAAEDSAAPAQPFRYESLEVIAPAPEETLWNIEGILNVSLALNPPLRPGHQVRVYFDGNAQLAPGTNFRLEEVYRGVHNIQAEILDETGEMQIRSLPNRFYVQQTSIVRPR